MWNTWTDQKVTRYERDVPRDPESGIIREAEPRELGPIDTGKAILMVHGFVGSPNNFNDLPDRVAASGWHVRVMLLPGHGTSPRTFETTSAAELEQAVMNELEALRERFSTVVLMGHSMGGALATLAAAQCPVDGLILASPYYAVTHRWYYGLRPETWARILTPAVRWVYHSPKRQPVNRRESSERIVSYPWIPTAGIRTAITLAAAARESRVTAGITMPTLLIHSRKDSVTDPAMSEKVFNSFPVSKKTVVWLHRSDHIIFWDYDDKQVIDEVLSFLETINALDCPARQRNRGLLP